MFTWRDSILSHCSRNPMICVCAYVCVKTQNDPDVLVVISPLIRTSGQSRKVSVHNRFDSRQKLRVNGPPLGLHCPQKSSGTSHSNYSTVSGTGLSGLVTKYISKPAVQNTACLFKFRG